jgi:hypothetical protein
MTSKLTAFLPGGYPRTLISVSGQTAFKAATHWSKAEVFQ